MEIWLISYSALQYLAPEIHWFCPANDDADTFDSVPIKSEDPAPWEHNAEDFTKNHLTRQDAFKRCFEFYAYDGGEAVRFQEILENGVKRNLARCDHCIVEYYRLQNRYIEHIES